MNNILLTLLVVVQVLSALGVIVLVLLQHGKGADMGAAFGSGASGSLFGATGSANFLSRTTGALATVFLVSTLGLAFVTNKASVAPASVMDRPAAAPTAPAAIPGAPAAIPGAPAAAPAAAAPVGETKPADGAAQKNGQSTEIPK
jgi:preprotein translocase subunit SecG